MSAPQTPKWTQADYDRAAEEYSLALQHAPEHMDRIRELENQLRELENQTHEQEQQMTTVVAALRPLVETCARLAGRQDILEQLPSVTDGQVLTRWLGELA